MKTRVTQSDIARVAGVHNTTVSLALRNNPLIPLHTRQRIQAIAADLGYFPDPALQALVAYRNRLSPGRRVATMAYVTNWSTRWGWRDNSAEAKYFEGAQRRASESGYQIEHIWLGEPGMSVRRLSSMLYHRAINGVILASHDVDCGDFGEMDWSRLSMAKIGTFPSAATCHRVCHDARGAMQVAMKRIGAAGYRRPGFAVSRSADDSLDQAWTGGFLALQAGLAAELRVPVLTYGSETMPGQAVDHLESHLLHRWLNRNRPDVILGAGSKLRAQLENIGVAVPRDVAFVDLFVLGGDSRSSGLREQCERVGEIAAELVVNQIQQNIRGLPEIPTSTLVNQTWVDGDSLPKIQVEFFGETSMGTVADRDEGLAVVQ